MHKVFGSVYSHGHRDDGRVRSVCISVKTNALAFPRRDAERGVQHSEHFNFGLLAKQPAQYIEFGTLWREVELLACRILGVQECPERLAVEQFHVDFAVDNAFEIEDCWIMIWQHVERVQCKRRKWRRGLQSNDKAWVYVKDERLP